MSRFSERMGVPPCEVSLANRHAMDTDLKTSLPNVLDRMFSVRSTGNATSSSRIHSGRRTLTLSVSEYGVHSSRNRWILG